MQLLLFVDTSANRGKKKIHFLNLFVHHQLSTLINTRPQTQLWGSKIFLKNAIQLRNLSRQKWIIVTKTIMNKKYPGILLRLANELENKLVRGQRLQSLLTQCPLLWERTIWIETYSSSLSFTTFFALPRQQSNVRPTLAFCWLYWMPNIDKWR